MDVTATGKRMVQMVEQALIGQHQSVKYAICCLLAGGHLLIEDVPGVGKTTLARALARVLGGVFRRIQFTSDLLPSDITGVSVWDATEREFRFKPGPVFGNVVLADEINRATPKTQSALLEAMSERGVSVDGIPRELPVPFIVVATQNEQERHGTYPLPESQLDRFLMRISMGYPEFEAERNIVSRSTLMDPVSHIEPVISPEIWNQLSEAVDSVHMESSIVDYLMKIILETRKSDLLELGVGPRGGMALHRSARAHALLDGRSFCIVDDVKKLVLPVLAHRVIPKGIGALGDSGRSIAFRAIREIVNSTEIPM